MTCRATRFSAAVVSALFFVSPVAMAGGPHYQVGDGTNWDFETGTLDGWTIGQSPNYGSSSEFNAFFSQPTFGPNTVHRRPDQPPNHQGKYWIGTYEDRRTEDEPEGRTQGDSFTGSLTSDPFVIDGDALEFLIGGGDDAKHVYVALKVDGQEQFRAGGRRVETMERRSWDVRSQRGQTAVIVIMDDSISDWGHINADDFRLVDSRRAQPTAPPLATATDPPTESASPQEPSASPAPCNWGFEQGLEGWTEEAPHEGAFTEQPTYGHNVTARRALERAGRPSLGGDYWDVPYPIGHVGDYWIGTFERRPTPAQTWATTRGDRPRGSLRSPLFRIGTDRIHFKLAGAGMGQAVRLWVEDLRFNPFTKVREAEPMGSEVMQWITWDVEDLEGKKAYITVDDGSRAGHISVDEFLCSDRPVATAAEQPVWGFADLHSHPMAHLSFGGLRGISSVWGKPGGRAADYVGTEADRLLQQDLPPCDGVDHGGEGIASAVLERVEHRTPHATNRETFQWPAFQSGAHQQHHITQIKRAYDGGMRLIVAAANNQALLEYAVSSPSQRHLTELAAAGEFEDHSVSMPPTTPEKDILDAFVCSMRRLASLNAEWMAIAYTPQQARRIIRSNRLAVVLGSELPSNGSLGFSSAEREVEYLHRIGIRQINPVHGMNNAIGGAAIFQDGYNWANDFHNRSPWQRRYLNRSDFDIYRPRFYDIREGGCAEGPRSSGLPRGECVLFRLDHLQKVAALDFTRLGPCRGVCPIPVDTFYEPYGQPRGGDLNADGLRAAVDARTGRITGHGADYIRALMSKGMIIDVDHMSDRTIDTTVDLLTPCGRLGGVRRALEASPDCFERGYPLISSHASYRAQSLHKHRPDNDRLAAPSKDALPKEFERSDSQIDLIRRLGGVLGPPLGADQIDCSAGHCPDTTIRDTCAGSSTGSALNYLYAVSKMGGRGVAISTDFTLHDLTVPRFMGPNFADDEWEATYEWSHVCSGGFTGAEANIVEDLQHWGTGFTAFRGSQRSAELELLPQHHRLSEQSSAIVYDRAVPSSEPRNLPVSDRGRNVPLKPYELGSPAGRHRIYDYNFDGLAHYGLIPDLLQDMKNLGVTAEQFGPLFRSADDYIRTWAKAWSVAGCTDPRCGEVAGDPEGFDCEAACSQDRCGFGTTELAALDVQRPDRRRRAWTQLALIVGGAAVVAAGASAVALKRYRVRNQN